MVYNSEDVPLVRRVDVRELEGVYMKNIVKTPRYLVVLFLLLTSCAWRRKPGTVRNKVSEIVKKCNSDSFCENV